MEWTFLSLGVNQKYTTDPLFQQYVNERVFEGIIKSKICLENVATELPELTRDELNAQVCCLFLT